MRIVKVQGLVALRELAFQEPSMELFSVEELRTKRRSLKKAYYEFLRSDFLSMGLYELPEGVTDPQQPHTEDEVYYVVAGRAQMRVGKEDQPVGPGSIISVRAGIEHRFHDIVENLTVLVFFAPAEYSRGSHATAQVRVG
jgi:mannose-6-phosphate isomerase-like protein (cupin superfamily)